MEFSGKKVVVFGGTSGIGFAIAQGFAEQGAAVLPVSRSPEKIAQALKKLGMVSGPNAIDINPKDLAVDVTNLSQIQTCFDRIRNLWNGIDVLVNSSGTHVLTPSQDMTEKDWDQVLDTNLKGAFFIAQAAYRIQSKQPMGGSQIHISSINGETPFPNTAAYCISKAGMNMMVKSLARDWAKFNVRVNAISPGVIPTDLNSKALEVPGRKEKILAQVPMGRLGDVRDLVSTALYLASTNSSYVTGTVIPVDGGFSCSGLSN